MAASYFTRLDESAEQGRYLAHPTTAGPWAAGLQHGGPPNALAVVAAQRALAAATGRADLLALRLAADFLGPVPVGEVLTRATVLRAGRSAALVEVAIADADRDCLRVRVWFVHAADTTAVASTADPPPARPDSPGDLGMHFGYADTIDWRFTEGSFTVPGPAAVWARPRIALIDDPDSAAPDDGFGTGSSGLARVALVADSASGISAELDWTTWSFANVDLDVHLLRPLRGDWVHLAARSSLGPGGAALARSTVSDDAGSLGAGLQTLVLTALPTA